LRKWAGVPRRGCYRFTGGGYAMEFWEGQFYETRSFGIIRIERTLGRSSNVDVRSWGREIPIIGGMDYGSFAFGVPERDLAGDVVREIRRFGDLGGCWVDPGVTPVERRPS